MSVVNRMLKDLEQTSNQRRLLIDVGETPATLNQPTSNNRITIFAISILLICLCSLAFFLIAEDEQAIAIAQKPSAASKSMFPHSVSDIEKNEPMQHANTTNSGDHTISNSEKADINRLTPSLKTTTQLVSTREEKIERQEPNTKIASAHQLAQKMSDQDIKNDASIETNAKKTFEQNDSGLGDLESKKPTTTGPQVTINRDSDRSKAESSKVTNQESAVKEVSNAQKLETQLMAAESMIKRGLLRTAENELISILKHNPEEHRAAEQLAYVYLQSNKLQELEVFLERRITEFPAYNTYQVLLARYYADNNYWKRIILLTNRPLLNDEALLLFRTLALQKLNQHEAAIELYGRLLKEQPSRGDWWIGLSISLNAIGEQTKAVQALNRAKNDPRLTSQQRQYIESRINRSG